MELTIKVAIQKELMTRQAADIAHRMSEFESRVLLKRQNLTVNAKSLMGVLSADLRDGQAVTILAEGPDEAQEETMLMLVVVRDFCEENLAIPVY